MAAAGVLERYRGLVRELAAAVGAEVAGGRPDKDPKVLIEAIIAEDKVLKEEAQRFKKQQALLRERERLTRSIEASDAALTELERGLRLVETTLMEALDDAKARLANIKRAEEAGVTVEELLSLAHRLGAAHSTTAPRDWNPDEVWDTRRSRAE